jgi:hypothetical protein
MSGTRSNGAEQPVLFKSIAIEGFDVTWAGENPLGSGFAYGSDDGRMIVADETGDPRTKPMKVTRFEEAINGIASFHASFAVSTRREVSFHSITSIQPPMLASAYAPHGSHGVTVAPSGHFVGALGRTGIMMARAAATGGDFFGVLLPGKEGMYFYRVIAEKGANGRDFLACAIRRHGIGVAEVLWGQNAYNMRTATFGGLDVVDVCSLGGTPESPSIAAIGADGTVLLVHDAMRNENPATIKFDTVEGTAYRILSTQGHVFVLTDRGLFVLMGLAENLITGAVSEDSVTPLFVVPMEAVDANLVGDRWLLVVMPDEVRIFDVQQIVADTPGQMPDAGVRPVRLTKLTPEWQFGQQVSAVQQESGQLAMSQ